MKALSVFRNILIWDLIIVACFVSFIDGRITGAKTS